MRLKFPLKESREMSTNLSGAISVIATCLFLLLLRELILSVGKRKRDPDNARSSAPGAYRGESANPVKELQTGAAFIETNELPAGLRAEAQGRSANSNTYR
jgi:hypothetical protein